MKKINIENVSSIKLDFFLKQNTKDIRVVLNPGECSWCDYGSYTKSMILYERKNLIKSSNIEDDNIDKKNIISDGKLGMNVESPKSILHIETELDIVPIQAMLPPSGEFLFHEIEKSIQIISPIEKAKQETEAYKKESENKPKGKKRGRHKKRGPKPGNKKRKEKELKKQNLTERNIVE